MKTAVQGEGTCSGMQLDEYSARELYAGKTT